MKKKLKAIWKILRAKKWVAITYNKNGDYHWEYSVDGVQPKGMHPAYERADIMLNAIDSLTAVMKIAADRIHKAYHNPQFND